MTTALRRTTVTGASNDATNGCCLDLDLVNEKLKIKKASHRSNVIIHHHFPFQVFKFFEFFCFSFVLFPISLINFDALLC